MSAPRSVRAFALFTVAIAMSALAPACNSGPKICTPATAGLGDQPRLERRDLPGRDEKEPCNPHVDVVRTSADLKAAYERAGVRIEGGGTAVPEAIPLPGVDFSKETVIVREELQTHPVSWMVASGGTLTIGSQGCFGANAELCSVEVFAVSAIVTKAEAYTCEDIGCSGSTINQGGGE